MNNCFWCGEPVGRQYAEMEVGGVMKKFHTNLFKDCANEYNKWRISAEIEPYINRLQLIGGHDEHQSEHHDSVKGLRSGHRFRPRLSLPSR